MQGKPFYKIGEVSKITGLQTYVLRFWESEFPSLHPPKNKGNQRVYTEADIAMVHRIKALLYEEGLTISGARKKLSEQRDESSRSFEGHREGPLIQRVRRELEALLYILK